MTVTCCDCPAQIEVRGRGQRPLRCPPCQRDRKRALGRAYWAKLDTEERRERWVEAKRPAGRRVRRMPPVVDESPRGVRLCADCRAEILHPHGPQRYCGVCAAERQVRYDRERKQRAAARKREASGKVAPVFSHPKVSDGEFLRRVAQAEAREREQEAERMARLTRRCDCGGLVRQGVAHQCGRVA